jgi:hypothetical protein
MPLVAARAVEEPAPVYAPEPVHTVPQEELRALPVVAPPAMIGPLATLEMVAKDEERSDTEEEKATAPLKTATPVEQKPRPEDFAIERCATMTVRLARHKLQRVQILEAEKLSAEQWTAIEKYWMDAIRMENKSGKNMLLERFDVSYIAQIEKERGPIDVQQYAKLMVAAERGTIDDLLKDWGLPGGILLRLERVWMKRLATHPPLGEEVQEAINKTRAL